MTGAPPRGLEQRLRDTRAKLESEVDLWVATSGSPGRELDEPYQYFLIRPRRIQAWREANELQGRVLMRDGRWLG
ncbi:hypothetical protein AB0F73_29890 [Micromonospora purpureochromogenes]|uniref:hypothetical protein n=1 Tax=Micromonospora purpureochromogenes TaxID=47872 RepID=UPI0033DC00C5